MRNVSEREIYDSLSKTRGKNAVEIWEEIRSENGSDKEGISLSSVFFYLDSFERRGLVEYHKERFNKDDSGVIDTSKYTLTEKGCNLRKALSKNDFIKNKISLEDYK